MDSKSNEPKPAKPEKSPDPPFLLEITPEKLVVPSTGNLEVKIRNPTEEPYRVHVHFDSFFWLMKMENEDFTNNLGDSKSMCFNVKLLDPGESCTLIIGYHDGKYITHRKLGEDSVCEEACGGGSCPKHKGKVQKVPPSERIYYNYERPEGILIVQYEWTREFDVEFPMKRMDLHLKDETEEYKKYREQFEEIRKEQARRARWKHFLVNEHEKTKRKFRDLDGTIYRFGDPDDDEWERDILPHLKQYDDFSDEQILKIRKERKEKIEEKHRKEEEEIKKRKEEYMKKMEEERKKEKEEEDRIKKEEEEMKKKKEKEEAAAKETSKVKIVDKSKRTEDPPQKIPTPPKPNSMKSKASVAPPKVDVTPTSKKPIGTPNATKNMKKKANPCCSIM